MKGRPSKLAFDPKTLTPGLLRPLEAFIQYLREERGASRHTLLGYESDLRQLAGWLRASDDFVARQGWKQVSHLTLRRYVAHLNKHCSATSAARKTSVVKAFFKWMEQEGILKENPSREVRPPKMPPPAPRVLTMDEIERLLAVPDLLEAIGKRDRALLEVLYSTGMRASECATLALRDVNWRSGQIRVRDGRASDGSNREVRTVLLGRPAQAALRDYLQNARPELLQYEERTQAKLTISDPAAALVRKTKHEKVPRLTCNALWISRRGNPLTPETLHYAVLRCARAAGLGENVTPHTLRHTCAAHLLANGADFQAVQELLGHRALASTLLYTRLQTQDAQPAHIAANSAAEAVPRRRGRPRKSEKPASKRS